MASPLSKLAMLIFNGLQYNEDLVLCHLPGKINPADALTKPLSRLLHERHCHCLLPPRPFQLSPPLSLPPLSLFFLFYPSLELLHYPTAHLFLSITSHISL
jgi:hypothetical protein